MNIEKMPEKMKEIARIGTLVAATLVGTPAESHVEPIAQGLEKQTQQQETQEQKFKRLRLKNESGLNKEPKKSRIAWKSKLTGATGHGEYIESDLAEDWLKKVQKEYPDIEHWLEPEAEIKKKDSI